MTPADWILEESLFWVDQLILLFCFVCKQALKSYNHFGALVSRTAVSHLRVISHGTPRYVILSKELRHTYFVLFCLHLCLTTTDVGYQNKLQRDPF